MKNDQKPMSRTAFMEELRRYQKGSVTRRHFLGVTGLSTAMAVMGGALPGLLPTRARAQDIGDRVALATWPNYHDPANFDMFAVFVPTNYAIPTYVQADLIEPLDLSKIPNFDPASFDPRFSGAGTVDGTVYAVPKNWGTTGIAFNSEKTGGVVDSWKSFFDGARDKFDGRVMVHDYQLTTIGNALVYHGFSFNSVDPKELAQAEKLLIDVKPHLYAISSDYQPAMRNGDAWLTMCWTGDGKQMNTDMPEIGFALGKEGGEIWSDYYAIPKDAPHKDAAYALINYLLDPEVNAQEALAHGYPVSDSRTNALLPEALLNDPILYPAAEALNALEFGAAVTLTDPNRAELMARFKSA
jgi:spermidine/putrescine transport system substrate-binding protein